MPSLLAQTLVVVKEDKRNVNEVNQNVTALLKCVDKINAAKEIKRVDSEPIVKYLLLTFVNIC